MMLVEDPRVVDITNNLKKKRLMRGYTQEALSEISGVNIKSIAAYEQDDKRFTAASAATVYRLADALGCDMEEIINKDSIDDDKLGIVSRRRRLHL